VLLILIKFSTSFFQTVRIWHRWNRLNYFTFIILLIYCVIIISYRYLYDTVFNNAASIVHVLRNINLNYPLYTSSAKFKHKLQLVLTVTTLHILTFIGPCVILMLNKDRPTDATCFIFCSTCFEC